MNNCLEPGAPVCQFSGTFWVGRSYDIVRGVIFTICMALRGTAYLSNFRLGWGVMWGNFVFHELLIYKNYVTC